MHYPGGKGSIYQKIINLIPPHDVYIETHLDGGAVIRNKRPARINIGIEKDAEVIKLWEDSKSHSFTLIHDDAHNFLKSYEFNGSEFVYCDPPYLKSSRKKQRQGYYRYDYSYAEHKELLQLLRDLPCKVMISGYESDLYQEMLADWHTDTFTSSCHKGCGIEWLWMNYSSPLTLHDYRYLGSNYRERERIKLKTRRWVRKLEKLPILERQALLYAAQMLTKN
jgi:site-specific DNA-adenine methylase